MDNEIETNYENLRMDREWSHDTLADHLQSLGDKRLAAHFRAKGAELAAQDVDALPPAEGQAEGQGEGQGEAKGDTTPPKRRRAPKTETA